MKLTTTQKIEATIRFAKGLIDAGWEKEQAIRNSQSLYRISKAQLEEVKKALV